MRHLQKVIPIDVARKARKSRGPQERPSTKKEVAAHFRVSEKTIGRWMKRGLPYDKPYEGGSVRFSLRDCQDWFSGQR